MKKTFLNPNSCDLLIFFLIKSPSIDCNCVKPLSVRAASNDRISCISSNDSNYFAFKSNLPFDLTNFNISANSSFVPNAACPSPAASDVNIFACSRYNICPRDE